MCATSGPDMALFKRFRKNCSKLNKKDECQAGIKCLRKYTALPLLDEYQRSTVKQQRDDYQQSLVLQMICFGGISKNGIIFVYHEV